MTTNFVGTNQWSNKTIAERFWEKVDVRLGNHCWNWIGGKHHIYGYGHFWVNGKTKTSSRIAWELVYGEIPAGLFICHKCDNPSCCNPDHLFLGTTQENMTDRNNKKHTACGEYNGRSKLTTKDVILIRSLYNTGVSVKKISIQFNVVETTIYSIIRGETWASV